MAAPFFEHCRPGVQSKPDQAPQPNRMMEIDYFLSLISPYTYMGHERFLQIAARAGATVNFKPTDLGKVFPVSGGLPLAKRSPQRRAYRMMELKRWREFLDVPLTLEPRFFPVRDEAARRAVIAAMQAGHQPGRLIFGFLRGVWAEERDISDPATIGAILEENGLAAGPLLQAAQGDRVAEGDAAITQQAIDAGVFGAPTYSLAGNLFWGQDRLDFLERALQATGGRPSGPAAEQGRGGGT